MPFKYRFASIIRCKVNRILKLDQFVNYSFSKNNFLNDSIAYVNERSIIKANISRTVKDTKMTSCTFGDTNVFFHSPKFDRNRGSHWMHFACIFHTVFRMFSCLQINCQPEEADRSKQGNLSFSHIIARSPINSVMAGSLRPFCWKDVSCRIPLFIHSR